MIIEEKYKEAICLLKDFFMMFEHATKIDFSNGVTHSGMDEGEVKGWKYYESLKDRFNELTGNKRPHPLDFTG